MWIYLKLTRERKVSSTSLLSLRPPILLSYHLCIRIVHKLREQDFVLFLSLWTIYIQIIKCPFLVPFVPRFSPKPLQIRVPRDPNIFSCFVLSDFFFINFWNIGDTVIMIILSWIFLKIISKTFYFNSYLKFVLQK